MSVHAAAGGMLAVVLAGALILLMQSEPRVAGVNRVAELEDAVRLEAGSPHCQDGQLLPAGTAGLRLAQAPGSGRRPSLEIVAQANGKRVSSGRLPVLPESPDIVVPLSAVERSVGARVCLRARGEGVLVLRGSGGLASFEWRRRGSESWFALLPTLAHRFGLSKSNPLGSLLLPAAALLLTLTWLAALRLLLREAKL